MAAASAVPKLLELFDLFWFTNEILKTTTKTQTSSSSSNSFHQNNEINNQMIPNPSTHSTSFSEQSTSSLSGSFTGSEDLSPSSVLVMIPKLQPVISGKVSDFQGNIEKLEDENKQEFQVPIKRKSSIGGSGKSWMRRRRLGRRGAGESKSLSDLESEELKGFMDLGFVFSEEDKDSRLVSIIPGLQRLGGEGERIDNGGEEAKVNVKRPYLSEAWDVMEEMKDPLMGWRLPDLSNEVDVKNQLRFWAHSVASVVI